MYGVFCQRYPSWAIWKNNDLSLYVILNALSCIQLILFFRLRLWNIQTNEQHPNCDSIKASITNLFYQFSSQVQDEQEHQVHDMMLQRLLTWSSNFKSLSIVILRSISFVCMFLSCHVRVSEWIHTLYLPECQGTLCSKQARNLEVKWLQLDSKPKSLSS